MARKDSVKAFQRSKPFEIPELQGKFTIRGIRGRERAQLLDFAASMTPEAPKGESDRKWFAIVTALCLGDEDGQRIFSDAEIDEASDIDATIQQRIADEGLEFNGLKPDTVDAEKKS